MIQACTWLATEVVTDDNEACQNVLSHTTVDELHNVATSGGARFVAVKKQREEVYDLVSGASLTTSTVDRSFDAAGNVIFESRSRTDAWTTNLSATTSNYTLDWPAWWLGKLESRIVSHHPVSQRHASSPVIVAGTDGLKQVTTTFSQYNAQRLPQTVTISANDTPLEQETDPATGLPTLVIDPNGLASSTVYECLRPPVGDHSRRQANAVRALDVVIDLTK